MMLNNFKCRACKLCDGKACIGELPGMGGVFQSAIFIENVKAWARFYSKLDLLKRDDIILPRLRLAPMAGGIQNVGWHEEKDFYFSMIKSAHAANLALSIGDGFPDEKLEYALLALQSVKRKGAIFLKPYSRDKLLKRVEKVKVQAEVIGVDIDAYNIITMRKKVSLEKKNAKDLNEIRKMAKLPFAIKGVFSEEDIEIVKELKPEIVIISNHGGRIERQIESSADFLIKHHNEISKYTNEVWVDGGIRCNHDMLAASALGASEVLIGRPIISAMIRGGSQEVENLVLTLKNQT